MSSVRAQMDIMLYVLLLVFCFIPSSFCVSHLVYNGCSPFDYNRSTCVYKLYCVNDIDFNRDVRDTFYNRIRNDICDHDNTEPSYEDNEYPEHINPPATATVHLTLKNYHNRNNLILGQSGDEASLAMTTSLLDLSSNDYYDFPNIARMDKLKVLNMSRNFLTEAKLYNSNDIPVLTEIDLSYNKITNIIVKRNQYIYRNLKKINLSHNDLIIIEDGIFNFFIDLEYLDLSFNVIQHLHVMTFEGIRNLKYFNLKHNSLKKLENFLFRFNKLNELDLSENNIQEINIADFNNLINLQVLDLSLNSISKVDENIFGRMILLKTLNFENNILEQLGKDLFINNTNLENINLSQNRLQSLPKELLKDKRILEFSITENKLQGAILKGNFEGLKLVSYLDLSSQLLTSVEDYAFYGLTNLNTLLLNGNKLALVSRMSFKTLRNLEVLDLSSNQLRNIEFDKEDLISLRTLFLQKNHLVQVKNEYFYGLNNLLLLDLSKNNISKLETNSFKSLTELINFQISDNPINGSLERSTFEGLNSLPRLDISGTLLNSIKNGSLNGMTHLKEFNASRCKISELQYNLFLHTGLLKTIDLSFNELSEFNINTTELVNLDILIHNNNRITKISSSFFNGMPNLMNVMISHNNIETVDKMAFDNLKYVQYLDLSYNPNVKFNVTQIEKMQSLANVILSGILTNVTFRDITETKLTHLKMSESNILNATSVGLNKLKNLEQLTLSKNNMLKLEVTAFNGLQSLKELDLSFNKIFFIQSGTFKDNALLNSLNISHNMLTSVNYGIFTGLFHLEVLDISYNKIDDLQSERFYEIPSLSELIVDHNKISNLEVNYFAETNLIKLSIGENPLPCHVLVKLDKVEKSFAVTAIRLADSSDDENFHGVTCNKDSQIDKQYDQEKVPFENILTDIRSILRNISFFKISENSLVPTATNDAQILTDIKVQIEKINSNLVVSNKQSSVLFDKLSTNISKSSDNNSLLINNTNLLLSKIVKAFDTILAARKIDQIPSVSQPVEISDDKKTVDYFMFHINKMKQEFQDTIAAEKVNIIKEIESKMTSKAPLTEADRAMFKPAVRLTHQEAYSSKVSNSDSYLFLEVSVGLILVILLAFALYKIYHSGVFFLNRQSSSSTRHLSDVIAL